MTALAEAEAEAGGRTEGRAEDAGADRTSSGGSSAYQEAGTTGDFGCC